MTSSDHRPIAPTDALVLVDALFPTGGFAHSLGLEPAIVSGVVPLALGLSAVEAHARDVAQSALDASAPFVLAARELALEGDVEGWCALNAECGATLASNVVAKRASVACGSATVRAAIAAFGEEEAGFLVRAKAALRERRRSAQHACALGAACAAAGLDATETIRTHAYVAARDCFSAATRLNASGPLETVGSLRRVAASAEAACVAAVARYERAKASEWGSDVLRRVSYAAPSAPIAETAQGAHDDARARLFNS